MGQVVHFIAGLFLRVLDAVNAEHIRQPIQVSLAAHKLGLDLLAVAKEGLFFLLYFTNLISDFLDYHINFFKLR